MAEYVKPKETLLGVDLEIQEGKIKDFLTGTWIRHTPEEVIGIHRRGGANSETKLLKFLKATQKNSKQLTEEQEEYLKKITTRLEEGALPKQTVRKALKALDNLEKEILNPLKVIGTLQREISPILLKSHYAETSAITEGKREVILSLYLVEGNDE